MTDNALKQYIELYNSNAALIDSHSAPALNALRPAALKVLEGASLPTCKTEGFEKTSIEEMFAPDYGVNISRVNIPVDVAAGFRCDVPNLSTLLAFTVNDAFVPTRGLDERVPEGVQFMSLARAAREMPEFVAAHLGTLAPAADPSVALNTLLCQDGVLIKVSRGVKVEKALQLVQLFSAPVALAAFRRILIVLEEGAELRLLVCDHTRDSERDYLASQVMEIFAGKDSRFEMCSIEESSARTARYSKLYLRLDHGAEATVNNTSLTCGNTRNEFDIELHGERSSLLLTGMAIGNDRMHVDNNSNVRHLAPRCHSNQLFKYVLDGESDGAFEGSILVTPQAPFTEAYQSNRNLLASTTARMHCKPQLVIYNDEVKCSHGATTGQLSEDALFYMQQRGIPAAEARTLLMQAFMADVIDSVHIPGLNERLRHLVERRFSGTLGDCAGCKAETSIQ